MPSGVHVKKVDYDNPSSLVEALRGQDALVITMQPMAPGDPEKKLMEAAAEANVPWVFPNEWGFDTTNEALVKDTLFGMGKKDTYALLTKTGKSSFIAVCCGFWYEWSLSMSLGYGFDLVNRAVTLYDEGETKICTSTWPQVGNTVASLLSLPVHAEKGEACLEMFKDNYVYVSSFTVSQKDMLDSVLRVTKTKITDWKVEKEPSQERYKNGKEEMAKGDMRGFPKQMYARVFYPDDSGNTAKTKGLQNELLGLPKENLDEFTGKAIERAKVSQAGYVH